MAWYKVEFEGVRRDVCSTEEDPKELARNYVISKLNEQFKVTVDGHEYAFELDIAGRVVEVSDE